MNWSVIQLQFAALLEDLCELVPRMAQVFQNWFSLAPADRFSATVWVLVTS